MSKKIDRSGKRVVEASIIIQKDQGYVKPTDFDRVPFTSMI